MPTLVKFEKQPGEVQDYDIDFTPYLTGVSDQATSHEVTTPEGIQLLSSTLVNGVVKVWIAGGTNSQIYPVTVRITTAGGRKREADIQIMVKD